MRPGNRGHVKGVADLVKPGQKVLVVNDSGQGGLWGDIAGRLGDIRTVRALRANIGNFAQTSADAKALWTSDRSHDAWVIWNIWQVANPDISTKVPIEPKYRVYRDTGVVLTQRGEQRPEVNTFATYLLSPEAAAVFARWGWIDASKKCASHDQPRHGSTGTAASAVHAALASASRSSRISHNPNGPGR